MTEAKDGSQVGKEGAGRRKKERRERKPDSVLSKGSFRKTAHREVEQRDRIEAKSFPRNPSGKGLEEKGNRSEPEKLRDYPARPAEKEDGGILGHRRPPKKRRGATRSSAGKLTKSAKTRRRERTCDSQKKEEYHLTA